MLATIPDDTWNVLNMQHINPNSKSWVIQTSPVVALKRLQQPPTWLKVTTTLEKTPTLTHRDLISQMKDLTKKLIKKKFDSREMDLMLRKCLCKFTWIIAKMGWSYSKLFKDYCSTSNPTKCLHDAGADHTTNISCHNQMTLVSGIWTQKKNVSFSF